MGFVWDENITAGTAVEAQDYNEFEEHTTTLEGMYCPTHYNGDWGAHDANYDGSELANNKGGHYPTDNGSQEGGAYNGQNVSQDGHNSSVNSHDTGYQGTYNNIVCASICGGNV